MHAAIVSRAKAMLRISSIFLPAIETILLSLTLSGCYYPGREQIFFTWFTMENKLSEPITYCPGFESHNCEYVIQPNSADYHIYRSNSDEDTDEQKLDVMDKQKIKICNKLVGLDIIRKASPIKKIDKEHFVLTIDQTTKDKVCN